MILICPTKVVNAEPLYISIDEYNIRVVRSPCLYPPDVLCMCVCRQIYADRLIWITHIRYIYTRVCVFFCLCQLALTINRTVNVWRVRMICARQRNVVTVQKTKYTPGGPISNSFKTVLECTRTCVYSITRFFLANSSIGRLWPGPETEFSIHFYLVIVRSVKNFFFYNKYKRCFRLTQNLR